jgi:hypothetical protein
VSYFTLRASSILKGTINDLYKRLIKKAAVAPVGTPWMWTLAFGYHEDRTPTHGYAETREAAMTVLSLERSCLFSRAEGQPSLRAGGGSDFPGAKFPIQKIESESRLIR